LIDRAARDAGVELRAIDRSRVAPGLVGEQYLQVLADMVRRSAGGRRPPILGFSIGAALALRVAARLGDEVGPLLLLSTAGPLDPPAARHGIGAGARVFRSARAGGIGLEVAVRGQAMLARAAPDLFRRMLFSGADPSDRSLADDPAHGPLLARVLRAAFADGGAGYRRDLLAYADDWTAELAAVTATTRMWHGRADRWSPIAMARSVAQALPSSCRLHEGASGHYSTLIACARDALADMAR
jgi:pimeloyl-ACP methyl ester carboxylesterase